MDATKIVAGIAALAFLALVVACFSRLRKELKRPAAPLDHNVLTETDRFKHAQRLSNIRGGSHITIDGERYKIDSRTLYTTRGGRELVWSRYRFVRNGQTAWLDIATPGSSGPVAMLTTHSFPYGGKGDPTELPFLEYDSHKHYLNRKGHAFYATQAGKTGELRYLDFQFGGAGNIRPQLEQYDHGTWTVCIRTILQPQSILVVA